MRCLEIILLITVTVAFVSAEDSSPSDCIEAEKLCLNDIPCNTSYQAEHCLHAIAVGYVAPSECQALLQSPLLHCKCRYGMKKEEHCLKIYWTVHPVLDADSLDSYDSPYEDRQLEVPDTEDTEATFLPKSSFDGDSTNACLNMATVCSEDKKCSRQKNLYVSQCNPRTPSDSCEQRKCHRHLRQFFEKVSEEVTKRLLFCPCQDSYCAERRRKTIVPECSFEEKTKQNCMRMFDSCHNDLICKSRLADYNKNCPSVFKNAQYCPAEQHGACLRSYLGMIGTTMTPNYINDINMDVSLWCTCEGSGNDEERCNRILEMFSNNRCLKMAIISEIKGSNLLSSVSMQDPNHFFEYFPVFSTNSEKNNIQRNSVNEGDSIKETASGVRSPQNTASGVSSPSLALTILSPMLLLWFLKLAYFM
ncbi:GDNF family receptor alpha-3 isoform 2-T2 [Discoglossus pictus]